MPLQYMLLSQQHWKWIFMKHKFWTLVKSCNCKEIAQEIFTDWRVSEMQIKKDNESMLKKLLAKVMETNDSDDVLIV